MKKQLILGLVLMGSVTLFGSYKIDYNNLQLQGTIVGPKNLQDCKDQCRKKGLIGQFEHGIFSNLCGCYAPTAKK